MALTHERLLSILHYDPLTGVWVWLVSPRRSVKKGDVAGYWVGERRLIMIDGKGHVASRLAWFYMKGEWPMGVVDHRDRNPNNDVFTNYRDVPQSVNLQNRSLFKTNKSGCSGGVLECRRWQMAFPDYTQ